MNEERKNINMTTTIRRSTFSGIYFRQVLLEQRLGNKRYSEFSRNTLPLSALRRYYSADHSQNYKAVVPFTRKNKVHAGIEKW